ncbi:hypothetical protein V6B14_22425 (plasmid) [Sporosarcina psychrophila]|uniref:hypothetical protein n=1 Tax=Sporosarcina psychrophila TaxID=1476 RepID=UPI0030CD869C
MKQKFSLFIGALLLGVGLVSFSSNASAAATLTQDQKEQHHQEYLKIAEELRVEYPDALTFEVANIEDFEEADWVEPEQYRERIIPIIQANIEVVDVKSPISTFAASNTPTKYGSVYSNSGTFLGTVVINATVSTVYDSYTNGQIISGISGVTSYTMQGGSHWGQTSANPSKVGARSWNLQVAGKFATVGVVISDVITVNYVTTIGGKIS